MAATPPFVQDTDRTTNKDKTIKHFSNFEAVLNNPGARVCFYEFLKSEYNSATVNFLNQMEYLCLTYGDQVEGRDKLEIFDAPLIQQLRMIYLNSIFYQTEESDKNFSGKAPENMSGELRALADEYYETVLGKEDVEEKSLNEEVALAAHEKRIKEYNKNANIFYQKFDLKNKNLLNGKSLFGAVHDDVLRMLCGDTFIRFQTSQLFRDFIKNLQKQDIPINELTVIAPRMSDQIKALRKNMKEYIDAVKKYKKEHSVKANIQSVLDTIRVESLSTIPESSSLDIVRVESLSSIPESSSIQHFFKLLPSIDDQTVGQKMEIFRKELLNMQTKLQENLKSFSNSSLSTNIRSLLASLKTVLIKSKMFVSNPSDADISVTLSAPLVTTFETMKLEQKNNKRKDLLGKLKSPSIAVTDTPATKLPSNVPRTGSRTLKENSARIARTHSWILAEMAEKLQANTSENKTDSAKEKSPSASGPSNGKQP